MPHPPPDLRRVLYLVRPPVQLLFLLLPAQDGTQAPRAAPPTLGPRWLLHQVPPHTGVVLQPVTCREGGLGSPRGPTAWSLGVMASLSRALLHQPLHLVGATVTQEPCQQDHLVQCGYFQRLRPREEGLA